MTKKCYVALSEVAAAAEVNALLLERMAREFPPESDQPLFDRLSCDQRSLADAFKAYVIANFDPSVPVHEGISEWYHDYIKNKPDLLAMVDLTDDEKEGIAQLGEL